MKKKIEKSQILNRNISVMHRPIFKRISVLNLAVQFFFFVSMIDNKLLLREELSPKTL